MDLSQITNQINQDWIASQTPQPVAPVPGANPWGTVSQADGNGRERQAGSMEALTWSPETGDGWDPGGQMTSPKNPYTGALGSAWGNYTSQAPGLQQNISQLQNKLGQSGYPAYQNSYGLGGSIDPSAQAFGGGQGPQASPVPGTASNPDYLTNPTTQGAEGGSSRGFNPWSLMGEANARGK